MNSVGYSFRIIHGGQLWHPWIGTTTLSSWVSPFLRNDYWMTFCSATIVALPYSLGFNQHHMSTVTFLRHFNLKTGIQVCTCACVRMLADLWPDFNLIVSLDQRSTIMGGNVRFGILHHSWVKLGQGAHNSTKAVTSKFFSHSSEARSHIMLHVSNFGCSNPSVA